MPTRAAILAAALLVTACSGGGETGNNSSDEGGGAVVEQTPSNLQDDPNNSVVPLTTPTAAPTPTASASASPVAAIPAAFLGRWGMVPNDCDPKQDFGAKGLMTIAADRLSFFESRAVPANIRLTAPTALTLDLKFSGEGQTWQQVATLTLLDDGKTLVREAIGGEKGDTPGAQRYSRCPATGGAA